MIVAMKKITFLMRADWIDEAIHLIREAGVLHVSHSKVPAGEDISAINNDVQSLEKAISLLEKLKTGEVAKDFGDDDAQRLVERIISLSKETLQLAEELAELENEYREAALWGDFDPHELRFLESSGIKLTLFSCPQKDLQILPPHLSRQVINRIDGICYVAAFSKDDDMQIPFRKIKVPQRSFMETGKMIEAKKLRRQSIAKELKTLAASLPLLKKYLESLKGKLEFKRVCAGMGGDEGIVWVKGFVPHYQLDAMKKLASKEHWGLIVEEPNEEDDVPTLIKHNRLSALFQPVMSFIGITPGYFEYDTNAVFIIFFSLFFAMIAGDAGYGLILLVAAFFLQLVKQSIPGHIKTLFFLLSTSTLIWGTLTGNWFGLPGHEIPLLEKLVVPGLDSFNPASSTAVMEICFFIALMHLSVAHLWKGMLSWPSLKVLGEGGWVLMLTGIYLLIKGLILKSASVPVSMILILSGFFMIILFGKQGHGSFLKGVVNGLKTLPVTALDGVGGLSNIVSYLRLFAVGMASKEVAAAFNAMALDAGFHDLFSIFVALLILLFGHTVNMLLIAMSVIVHGIRLNILEYSGHMNIEWSGVPYKPFHQLAKEKGTTLERANGGTK